MLALLLSDALHDKSAATILSSRLLAHTDQATVPNLLLQYVQHALGLRPTAPYPTSLWSILTLPAYIDYCEPNYYYTPHIAELFNTLSNLSFILSACYALTQCHRFQLPFRFYAIALFILLTGVNSAVYHATLSWIGLKADEISENLIFIAMVNMRRHWVFTMVHSVVASLGVCFFHLLLFCEIHIVLVSVCTIRHCYTRMVTTHPHIRRPFLRAFGLSLAGEACWVMDHVSCSWLGSGWQFHAWWHVLMGACIHQMFVVTVMVYGRDGVGDSGGVVAREEDGEEQVHGLMTGQQESRRVGKLSGDKELAPITAVPKYYLDWLEQGEVVIRKHS